MKLTSEQKIFIREHEGEDIRNLALKLDKKRYSELDSMFLIKQIAGRQITKKKVPSWYENDNLIYPVHISLEQASSEATAQYKASLFENSTGSFIDLTGGLGVDCSFLSKMFSSSVYVEQNEALCNIAKNNFAQIGLENISVINDTSENYIDSIDNDVCLIYLDPARRDDSGRKVVMIEDCSPDLTTIQDKLLKKSEIVLVKYSPMLDIDMALKQLTYASEVHIVSVDNECKELLFKLDKNSTDHQVVTVNIKNNGITEKFEYQLEDEAESLVSYSSEVLKYLYEPNASILKAGAFKSVAQRFNLFKLHPNSHLYTSDKLIEEFPGRTFEITDSFSPNNKNIKYFKSQTTRANVSVRNFPMSVPEIRKKTKIKDGGSIYLFATTLNDNQKVWIVCKKAPISN